MCGWPSEINFNPVAAVLRDVALEALDDCSTGTLKRLHHRPEVLRVEARCKPGRVHQIAEHHRDLATFSGGTLDCRCGCCCPSAFVGSPGCGFAKFRDRREQLGSGAKWDSNLFE